MSDVARDTHASCVRNGEREFESSRVREFESSRVPEFQSSREDERIIEDERRVQRTRENATYPCQKGCVSVKH
jgi:hypothetical protein